MSHSDPAVTHDTTRSVIKTDTPISGAELLTLAVMREYTGNPNGRMEAFDPATFLMIFEMIMEIIAECQEKRGKRYSSDEVLARAQNPSRRHRRRSILIARRQGLSRRDAREYVDAASRAAANVTAQEIDDAITEEENAFAYDE